MALATTCDKSKKRAVCSGVSGVAYCPSCGKQYARCADHGGQTGANRSLRGHFALVCYADQSIQRKALNPGRKETP
jgi:hypothetical protein